MSFKEGDLVRIFKQPPNQLVPLEGKRGYVDEVLEDEDNPQFVNFRELPSDGRCGGMGTVPVDCLTHDLGEDLKQRKAKRDADFAAYCADIERRSARFTAGLEKIAEEFDLPTDVLRQIHRRLRELDYA